MPSDDIRASDQEREDAVRLLCEAYADGRLELDEIRARAAAVYSARTRGELRRLTADLPLPPGAPAQRGGGSHLRTAVGPGRRPARSQRPVGPVLLTALAWLAIAAADLMPAMAAAWAVLPLIVVSMSALFAAGRIASHRDNR